MNDANGHPLAIGDIVKTDNDSYTQWRIDAFDGTLCSLRYPQQTTGPAVKFLPVHLIWVSTP